MTGKDSPQYPAAEDFIRKNLRLQPVRSVPEILLYSAHSESGLGRLARLNGAVGAAPYWAYHWAGGTVLARHILSQPQTVSDRHVLDLGSGSGLVAIAAANAGAAHITAIDIDIHAIAAIELNAAANGTTIETLQADILDDSPPDCDVILAGDVFYDARLASRILPFLVRCRAAGIGVLIGDPGRAPLPRERLRLVRAYAVADFGADMENVSGVYSL
ncbi:ribosomal RNA methyltransferase protein [Rhizobium etli 8C-3]|uniref:Ribosomal RNA methyltransferase protein n=2 Tax=Rhizobium TaxID=379 RepID=A0A1L5P408_RHIET|nr:MULTISPECIES: 50S ribosomal protein L11 methyltransferase [Rhizobium]APO74861.1 ribosomal RNA methyltransferase protein [Rhizobium etli 8C-3]TCU16774.1 putative nicotinamide N-methyase [Rhizobium azibense]